MGFFWEEKSRTKPFAREGGDDSSSSSGVDGHKTSSSASTSRQIDVVSARLNQMSLEERSDALHDLHGVGDDIDETPEFLEGKHQELGRALLSCIASAKPEESLAFRKALRMSKAYVDGFKLLFLRADMYQSEMAANRMIAFFSRKMELFGEDLLVQDIQLKHLTDEEKESLHQGIIQLLPQRDRAGRAIFMIDGRVNVMYPDTRGVVSPQDAV
jgi:hypothetical protein